MEQTKNTSQIPEKKRHAIRICGLQGRPFRLNGLLFSKTQIGIPEGSTQSCKDRYKHTFRRKSGVLASICLFLLAGSGCGILESAATVRKPAETQNPVSSALSATESSASQNSDSTTAIYDVIYEALNRSEESITFFNAPEDAVIEAYTQLVYEHPEFYWADYGYSGTTTTLGSQTQLKLEPKMVESRAEIIHKRQQLDEAVESILSGVPAGTDFEKALYVHDYLVLNTEYDIAVYRQLQDSENQSLLHDATNAYGCLVNHSAICDGYAKAFQLLMNRLGIEAGRVSGTAGGGAHAWNFLVLDGEPYYVDVTWDDPVSSEEVGTQTGRVSHAYFCITTDALLEDHEIGEENSFVPSCTALQYEYFRYTGTYLDTYSRSGVEDLIAHHNVNNSVEIEFGSQTELQAAVAALFDNLEIFNIPYVRETCSTVRHAVSNSRGILTIMLGDG